MTIKIKNQAQTTTFLESTGTIESGENMPRVFFSRDDWKFLSKLRWKENKSVQREGNFQHYDGSDDVVGTITLYLTGSTRNTNLETVRDIKEVIYLDCDDVNSNDSGNYTLKIRDFVRNENASLITVNLGLTAYNN